MYSCPECEQPINQASEVCPYCGADQKALADTELLLAGKTPKSAKANYKRVAVVCGVLLATLWAIAWFAVPWKLSGSKTEAEARARESLATIQQAISTYEQSEGGAPPSLETLGDTVRKAAQSAQLVHYTVQYAPGRPDPAGRVTAYTLTARAGNFGYRSFYTDESAIVRATTEDRAATVQDSPLNAQP
jgi:RNA polymerase subunit RPABC4/transcription elongation factor Spt4